MFVLVSPSEATDNQFAGHLSDGIVLLFVVRASNGWRRSTARQTFMPDCVIVFSFRDQGPSDDQFVGQRSDGIVLLFVIPASNGWRQSTARQTFDRECVIVFWLRDQRPSDNQFAG